MRTKRLVGALAVVVLVAVVGAAVALAATAGSGPWGSGFGMMGGRYVYQPATPGPVRTLSAARSDAQRFADRLGLRVDEVLQFERNFYVKLVDRNGNGATEVLVDPASGVVSIEYGPAMMWNTRYGMGAAARTMMGSYGTSMMRANGAGMMGASTAGPSPAAGYGAAPMMGGPGYNGSAFTSPTVGSTGGAVSLASAHTLAQRWLDANEAGVKVETGGDAFPGYYTLETLAGGKVSGMISVNATTDAVWPHWWHGAFIAKSA
ncbi:MAG TPA: hypothetical protein VMV16_02465 [Solirubrobacteraceae bacterium]|nr:hypothetical protein [Solirubrobacteraceae bacterium]